MVNKKFCDLCEEEMEEGMDRVYTLSYGQKSFLNISGNLKTGEICEDCFKELRDWVKSKRGIN